MNVRIQVVVDNGTAPIIQEVACLERPFQNGGWIF